MNPVHDKPEAASAGTLVPDVVSEIPVAAPDAAQKPADDDDELDKIMHDVGKDIKDIGKKKPKRHWFSHDKKTKSDPKFSARPIDQITPAPAVPAVKPPPAAKAAPAPAQQPAKAAKKAPKPPKASTAPVGVVIMAIIVTGGLIAAAYYAYK